MSVSYTGTLIFAATGAPCSPTEGFMSIAREAGPWVYLHPNTAEQGNTSLKVLPAGKRQNNSLERGDINISK